MTLSHEHSDHHRHRRTDHRFGLTRPYCVGSKVDFRRRDGSCNGRRDGRSCFRCGDGKRAEQNDDQSIDRVLCLKLRVFISARFINISTWPGFKAASRIFQDPHYPASRQRPLQTRLRLRQRTSKGPLGPAFVWNAPTVFPFLSDQSSKTVVSLWCGFRPDGTSACFGATQTLPPRRRTMSRLGGPIRRKDVAFSKIFAHAVCIPSSEYIEFELRLMPRRGTERTVLGRMWVGRDATGPATRFSIASGVAGGEERLLVQGGVNGSIWSWEIFCRQRARKTSSRCTLQSFSRHGCDAVRATIVVFILAGICIRRCIQSTRTAGLHFPHVSTG